MRLWVLVVIASMSCGTGGESDRQTKKIDASGNTSDSASDESSASTDAAPTSVDPPTPTTNPGRTPPDTVSWGDDGHGRRYRLFIPGTIDPSGDAAPLVVMLHGCDQDATDFAAVTGMDAVARREGFVVAYPEQSRLANAYGCWNWFMPTEQMKSGEEARFIVAVIAEASVQAKIDHARVFAAGISAGAAMAVILGSCFPETFRGVAAHSGLAFKAANTAFSAASIMSAGPVYTADQSAEGSKLCSGGLYATAALAITGDADSTVNPEHSSRVYEQFRALADWADDGARNDSIPPSSASSGSDGRTFVGAATVLQDGRSVETMIISGLGHAWSGGTAGFAYSDPSGPSATEEIWRFFSSQP